MNFYQVLNVGEQASQEEIRTAYLHLARENHPDRHVGERTEEVRERFKRIQEAYEVLCDPAQRQVYDAKRIPQPRQRQANSAAAPQSAVRANVRPITPGKRRDVPDDWLRRGRTKRKRPILITVFIVGIVSLATMVVPRCSDYVEQMGEVIEIPELKPLPGPEQSSQPMTVAVHAVNEIQEASAKEIPEPRLDKTESRGASLGDGFSNSIVQNADFEELSRYLNNEVPLDQEPMFDGQLFSNFEDVQLQALPTLPELPAIDLSALHKVAESATDSPTTSSETTLLDWLNGTDSSWQSEFEGLNLSTQPVADTSSPWSGRSTTTRTENGGSAYRMNSIKSYGRTQTQSLDQQLPDAFSSGHLSAMPSLQPSVQPYVPPLQIPPPPGATPVPIVSMAIDQNVPQLPAQSSAPANSGFDQNWGTNQWNGTGQPPNYNSLPPTQYNRFQPELAQ